MKWNRWVMIVLCAAMAMGGTFVCKSGDDDGVVVKTNTRSATTR